MVEEASAWSTRMDHYLKMGSDRIHLAAILFSLGVITSLACLLLTWLRRGLKKDYIEMVR